VQTPERDDVLTIEKKILSSVPQHDLAAEAELEHHEVGVEDDVTDAGSLSCAGFGRGIPRWCTSRFEGVSAAAVEREPGCSPGESTMI